MQTVSFIICGIVVSGYLLLINDFISVWLGNTYVFDLPTVLTIALNLYFGCVLQPIWSYREATGLYTKTKYIMLITAGLNIVFSLVMGKCWGIKGILLASIVSRILTYIWYEPYLLFKQYFNRPVRKYYMGLICNVILVLAIVFINQALFKSMIVNSWFSLFLKVAVIGVATVAEFIGIYIRTEGCRLLIDKVKYFVSNLLNKQ